MKPKPADQALLPVRVAGREIGAGRPAYLIAEAGVNHNGSLETARSLIDVAAAAGADAVKFQVFRADELASTCAAAATYQERSATRGQREMLRALELSDGQFARLRDHCRDRNIQFLATPFGPNDVARLLDLDVPAIKTASTDLDNLPLLQRVAEAGLPLFVSTGAAKRDEIIAVVRLLDQLGALQRTILLHCVSCYPTPLEAANLRAIRSLQDLAGVPTGFSDHTRSTTTGALAVAAGACLLEKHFTLDPADQGPDHAMSLDPDALRAYIHNIRSAEQALGTGAIGLTDLEKDVRLVARKSVVSKRHLIVGTVLTPEMLTLKRPGGGIEPRSMQALMGRTLQRDVEPDTMLTWDAIR